MRCVISSVSFIVLLFIATPLALAFECGDQLPTSSGELAEYIDSCNQTIAKNQDQQQTLKQAITTLNSKISLAQAQINQTQAQLNSLKKEIEVLSGVLDTVNLSMDQLAEIYIARVRESYKRYRSSRADMIFSTNSIGDFLEKMKYLNTVKAKDQLILTELEKSRLDYGEKKDAKIEKQKEVEKLNAKLIAQRKGLASQQQEKNNFLTLTQSDEKKYQQLLNDAKAQLAAFNKFVANQGGASILSNTTRDDGSWGKYYNQRDSLWGNKPLGISSISVADAGCLITSMAMVMTHHGKSITPGNIAANSGYFSPYYPYADFRQGDLNISGVSTKRTRIAFSKSSAISILNDELSSNGSKPVIVGIIRYGSSKPEHFIVIKSKDGDDYIMNDPFFEDGMNIKFKSKYSLSDIATVDRVTVY